MSTLTLTPADVITPDATDTIHTATAASDRLQATLTKAVTAGNTVVTARYGADTDTTGKRSPLAAVKLAKRVADDISGAAKAKGARADVLAVLSTLGSDAPTDVALVAASRVRLDAEAARKVAARKAESEARAAANAVYKDNTRSKADRLAAVEALVDLDENKSRAKSDAAWLKLTGALESARAFGFTREQIATLADSIFGLGI